MTTTTDTQANTCHPVEPAPDGFMVRGVWYPDNRTPEQWEREAEQNELDSLNKRAIAHHLRAREAEQARLELRNRCANRLFDRNYDRLSGSARQMVLKALDFAAEIDQ